VSLELPASLPPRAGESARREIERQIGIADLPVTPGPPGAVALTATLRVSAGRGPS